MKWNRVNHLKWNVLALSDWNKKDEIINFDTFLWKISSKLKCSCRTTRFQQNWIFRVLECSAETFLSSCRWTLSLGVCLFVNLPFSEMKATRHVKSTIHFGNPSWIMQLHLKPESHCDKAGSDHSMKYFDMCPPLTRLPHRASINIPPPRMISVLGFFSPGDFWASNVPEHIIQKENLGVTVFPNSFTRAFIW